MNHGFLISPLLNTVITFQALPTNISWLFVVSFDTCCILLRKGPKGPPRVPPMVPQGSSKGFLKGPPRVTKGPQGCFNKPVQQDVFGAVKPKKIDQKHCHAPGEHCSWKGGHFSSPRAESKLSPRWQAAQDHPRAFGDHCCESLNLWELLTSCPGQASQAVCSAHYDKKCAPSAKGGISSYPWNWDGTPSTGFEFADFGFGKIRCVPTPFSCPILSVAVCELLIFIAWFHIFLSQIPFRSPQNRLWFSWGQHHFSLPSRHCGNLLTMAGWMGAAGGIFFFF